jgi:hypothetical protein
MTLIWELKSGLSYVNQVASHFTTDFRLRRKDSVDDEET